MRLNRAIIRKLIKKRDLSLQALLRTAGVSRTAYYSLARRESVLPGSIHKLARALGVSPSDLLSEAPPAERRARELMAEAQDILRRSPAASFENVWHTLVLLEVPPVERLRRSLQRGRGVDIH